MFEVGDKIICIDQWSSTNKTARMKLTQYKEYIVLFITHTVGWDYVHIKNDDNTLQDFLVARFISVSDFRKMKIDKITKK